MNATLGCAAVFLLAHTMLPLVAEARGVRGDDGQREEPLVQHIVPPQATDPQIDTFLDPHYVWLDPEQAEDPKLWLFLPSAGAKPAEFQLIAKEAARLGYHVISLMYPNGEVILSVCNPLPPEERENCYENIRLQTLDGIQRSDFSSVNPSNSIYNRVTKVLQYLAATFPKEGWRHFLKDGAPRWSRIVVAGHSQGGGNAAMIGKLHRVARVVMISSPPEGCMDSQCQAARWVAIGATPANRYYGLAHQRELPIRAERANWEAFGLNAFGAPVTPETSAPPYGCTHMLITNLDPAPGGYFVGSTARDSATPRLADGTPALRNAWRYISAIWNDSDSDDSDDFRELATLARASHLAHASCN